MNHYVTLEVNGSFIRRYPCESKEGVENILDRLRDSYSDDMYFIFDTHTNYPTFTVRR